MATTGDMIQLGTCTAQADLSLKQFRAVKVTGNKQVGLCVAGDDAIGILQNKPGINQASAVAIGGSSKAIAGAAVAAGALVASDVNGAIVAALATNYIIGVALSAAGGAGEIISVLLRPGGKL